MLAAAGVLAVLLLVVFVVPRLLYPPLPAARFAGVAQEKRIELETNRLKLQNDARATLLQALAGGVLLLGAYFTWRQLGVTREGQITDRYTKAVDQLGSDHLDVRVGGIYALERIARDSPDDRATIEEVLTAYVRDHAPWPAPLAAPTQEADTHAPRTTTAQLFLPDEQPAVAADTAGQPGSAAKRLRPAADVQAAVTVLGRRQLPSDGLRSLDLTRVDLRGVRLTDTNLQGAMLRLANLQGAMLDNANLQGAWLDGANLQDALLEGANLQGAQLGGAKLQGAWLGSANLQGAELVGANLQGVILGGANLQDARLIRANLQRARADEATRWPDGWAPETVKAHGVVIEEGGAIGRLYGAWESW